MKSYLNSSFSNSNDQSGDSSNSNQQQSTSDMDTAGSQEDPADGNCAKLNPSPANNTLESNLSSNEEEEEDEDDRSSLSKNDFKKTSSFIEKFNQDYDGQVEEIADKATDLMATGSFFNCGLYQFISFIFVSIAWTVGNGWYAYVSVFTGYTPEHECDYTQMGANFSRYENDSKCFALDTFLNQSVKCTKWKYETTQMISTLITEYDFVCDKNYYFELAYSIEQIGYIVGTLIFSFVADIIGRKPVLVGVLVSMSVCGLAQYFVANFVVFMVIGFVINSLACGLEAVCVTLVLEMFSTSKRTLFGIGIEVVWVLVLASMAPLAYAIKLWREIRLAIFVVLALLAITSPFFVQESIRWLISMANLKKAERIIHKIIKYNRLDKKKNNKYALKSEQLNQKLSELEFYNKLQVDSSYLKKSLTKGSELSDPQTLSSMGSEDANILKSTPTQSTLSKRSNNTVWDILKNSKFRIYVLIMSLNW